MKSSRILAEWTSPSVKTHLSALLHAASTQNTSQYREQMHALGRDLGRRLAKDLPAKGDIVVVCSNEDADFLCRGVLEEIEQKDRAARLLCYANERDIEHDRAPIVSRYEENFDPKNVRAVVVAKAIISSGCVVRTNLSEALDKLSRSVPIFIIAPVMHKDAEAKLTSEFAKSVADRFEYLWCAVDSEKQGDLVVPGVGGSVYQLLGYGDGHTKNRVRPKMFDERTKRTG